MNKKKIYNSFIAMGLSSLLFLSGGFLAPVSAYADTITDTAIESGIVDDEVVNNKLVNLQEGLIKYVESLGDDVRNDEHVDLSSYFENLDNSEKLTADELKSLISTGNAINSRARKLNYSDEERQSIQIVKSVKTDNNINIEFYNNGLFSVENNNLMNDYNSDSVMNSRAVKTVWGQAYKDYHNYIGTRTFTVAVGAGFTYDGSTAGYSGGFTAYYKKGTLTLWKVENWEKNHKASGKNYKAYCSADFTFSFDVQGNSMTIQDLYVEHIVTCYPNGQVLRDFIVI